jgi:hypothetical protein
MSVFTPGQFKQSLQNKIKQDPNPVTQEPRSPIINTDPSTFARPASTYAAKEMQQIRSSVQHPSGTANLPSGSIMKKSVHERMTSFVKGQYGGNK